MKTLIVVLVMVMFLFSSLSAQVQRDTVNGWYFLGLGVQGVQSVQGSMTTSYTAYTRLVHDTSTEGSCSQAFDVNIPMGTTTFWGKKFNHSYARPWGIAYDKMLSVINPNDILHITDVGIRIYLHYSDRDTISMVPLTDCFGQKSKWGYIERPVYRPGTSLPDSIDGIIIELGFDPTMSGSFEVLFDNLNFMYISQGPPVIRYRYEIVDRFGDPDPGLPVELTSFSASVSGSSAVLNWTTATEVNNYGFDVERRAVPDGIWGKIGFVSGSGTSNSHHDYIFTDANVVSGHYIYRLKQVDNDGAFKYSQSVEVEIDIAAPERFDVLQNYPNPFNPSTTIEFSLPNRTNVNLKIYNTIGQEVETIVNSELNAGTHRYVWNAGKFPSGTYFYRLNAGSFVETKKMLLVK